ncbi:MAG TPA: tripartite tricarboxylate transporter substrate binding protein [Burkholderiales bacterium]|nr:tripartite tricarboxylate transporter substrate binding protein [Burkholderiales bacterium]
MKPFRFVGAALCAAFVAAGTATLPAARAQDYPAKPVRILLGFPVGQATDILTRIVAAKLTTVYGQQFYVENRPGAAGIIATELAAKAEPDGYTLLGTSSGPLTVNPALYAKLPYDVARDFTLVSGLGVVPYAIVVNPASPIKDIKGLVAYAKANPGKLNYASGGSGVTNHLVTEMFKSAAGVNMQHVPYKGGPAALTDLVSGQVDLMFETIIATLPLVKSGKLRAIAVSSAERSSALPDLPTISESGYPGFSGVPWVAMAAPAKTPKPIVTKLHAEITKILSTPEVRQSFQAQGTEPLVMTFDQLNEFVKNETVKWAQAVKASGAKVD